MRLGKFYGLKEKVTRSHMSKQSDKSTHQEDVLEIIELATNDLNTLARAFDLISEVCQSRPAPAVQIDNRPSQGVIH